jgi:protein-L-isoaspartate(D-aspartate) O-methyltransferase
MMPTADLHAAGNAARRAMIESQLRVSGVNDTGVLDAFARIAREDFVPAAARGHAYIDRAIPLGDGRALAAPLVHGLMLVEARATPVDKVLVVSGGSGYLAAVLKQLVASVDEIDAADALKKRKGAYSLILIDGAIEHLPDTLTAQLAEGGRIVTGLVVRGVPRLAAGRKIGGVTSLLPLAEIGIPVLAEFAAPKHWSF